MSQHFEQLFPHIGNETPIIALRHKLLGARAPLMTVRTHVWADLTSCKYSQLSSSSSLSLTCSVNRPRCLGVLWLIKNFRFCIWSPFWKNWYFSEFINILYHSSWDPAADEVLYLVLMRNCGGAIILFSTASNVLLHGHLGPEFQLANAINPPATNRGRGWQRDVKGHGRRSSLEIFE